MLSASGEAHRMACNSWRGAGRLDSANLQRLLESLASVMQLSNQGGSDRRLPNPSDDSAPVCLTDPLS